MNVQKVDSAEANEESNFTSRFLEALLKKEIILPLIGMLVLIATLWAFVTKCGRKPCCNDNAVSSR